ncbi:molybdopterin converting factor subunit 1 [Massilia sp. PAMC28688]|uniref:molybdopterin converting factor subunit 1 n=1 Tax=Massilia sp. PAMC28688 TaxID=2861283 RepID=UPI001C639EB4|nr:molybdopterin converting factor subunit 1 [Massilia sp. PAMC28688]QYF93189.1 molybdopterin converting factor subunit 1 [Massilia sp. PAMC28688]
MRITLRFFASVREQLGTSQEQLTLPAGVATVGEVRTFLQQRGGLWSDALGQDRPLRMAFNHVMCAPDTAIADGGEVAFFPPVTGG